MKASELSASLKHPPDEMLRMLFKEKTKVH